MSQLENGGQSEHRNQQTDIDLLQVLRLFLLLAEQASSAILALEHTRGDFRAKVDGSPVTEADEAANQVIVKGLRAAYPQIPILAEESPEPVERQAAFRVFLVDPLDGTKEYLAGNGEYTVNIALIEHGQPLVGVVHMPTRDWVFCAIRGKGAWMKGPCESDTTAHSTIIPCNEAPGSDSPFIGMNAIHVSDRTDALVLACSRSHQAEAMKQIASHPKVASLLTAGSSLKGCLIACGRADAYYRFGRTMEWDTAAMQIIVEEAGGLVRQMDGTPLVYNKPEPDNPKGFFMLNREENRLWP